VIRYICSALFRSVSVYAAYLVVESLIKRATSRLSWDKVYRQSFINLKMAGFEHCGGDMLSSPRASAYWRCSSWLNVLAGVHFCVHDGPFIHLQSSSWVLFPRTIIRRILISPEKFLISVFEWRRISFTLLRMNTRYSRCSDCMWWKTIQESVRNSLEIAIRNPHLIVCANHAAASSQSKSTFCQDEAPKNSCATANSSR
jgi:hypothetical protein